MTSVIPGSLTSTVVEQITSTLLPTVTKIDARDDSSSSSLSLVLAFSIVFVLAPITISGNTMILAAFYRYKRLRTASNCLLASLAVSDFGVGVFIPFGVHLELSGAPDSNGISTTSSLYILPYCIVITLCSASVLVTVAIAVDRLTSLAQPLRYKNIITHSSVEKYIAVFWIYAIIVGLSPLIYAKIMGSSQTNSGSCRFGVAVQPPVRVFLVVAVWAPSALVLLGCYIYVYLVARAHARAIYTVELSFRHQTQTLALPRYGQTLAATVGAFLILWLPFQACMLLDIFYGTHILSEWSVVWLGLPILAHSGVNPWIYAFHHGEMRVAAGKIAEDVVTLFGIHPSRYGCTYPVGRGDGSNLELAEVNKSNDHRRPPIEDCFAEKQLNNFYPTHDKQRQLETTSNEVEISPEVNDCDRRFIHCDSSADIIEEHAHDLVKMLGPEYGVERSSCCHVIDTNHNVDKTLKNIKYLLDPTFNKIRHLRRLNKKSTVCCHNNNIGGKYDRRNLNQFKFISYQNLKSDIMNNSRRRILKLNAMSDPILNNGGSNDIGEGFDKKDTLLIHQSDNVNPSSVLASMSDSNIKAIINLTNSNSHNQNYRTTAESANGYSAESLNYNAKCSSCQTHHCKQSAELHSREVNTKRRRSEIAARWRQTSKQITVTANKLTNFFHSDHYRLKRHNFQDVQTITDFQKSPLRIQVVQKNFGLSHSESTNEFVGEKSTKLLEPSRFINNILMVPTIHSEPPSPVDPPISLNALREEEILDETEIRYSGQSQRANSKSPVRHSDPFPCVLLNIEDFDVTELNQVSTNTYSSKYNNHHQHYEKTIDACSRTASENSLKINLTQNLFPEHLCDSTRFNSRRPSDLRWSGESSRSQEVLSNSNKHQKSPSSYSVNNVQSCDDNSTSAGDLNDITCLDSFMCPDVLSSSSLRESFFEAPSIPDSDTFDDTDVIRESLPRDLEHNSWIVPTTKVTVHSSISSVNVKNSPQKRLECDNQSKSTDSVMIRCRHAILRLQLVGQRGKLCSMKGEKDVILEDLKKKSTLAPLAISTPIDICTPTISEPTVEIKGVPGIGVRV